MVAILCYCAIALLLQYRQACDGTGAYGLRSCEVRAVSVPGISRSTALSFGCTASDQRNLRANRELVVRVLADTMERDKRSGKVQVEEIAVAEE